MSTQEARSYRIGEVASRVGVTTRTIRYYEERGLLGSRYYCAKGPLFPMAETAAMVNLDMVGRLSEDKETKKEKPIPVAAGDGFWFLGKL